MDTRSMTLTEYIREQARVADANSKEWMSKGGEVNANYRAGMWYAYNDVEARVAALEANLSCAQQAIASFLASITPDSDNYVGGIHKLQLEQCIGGEHVESPATTLLEEAHQLIVTASGQGEYGTGPEWWQQYNKWKQSVNSIINKPNEQQ